MSKLKTLITIGVSVALAASVAVAAAPATAAPSTKGAPAASSAASDGYVIVNAKKGVAGQNGATFYPTGVLPADTLVVITEPDGSLPNGMTTASLKTLVANQRAERAANSPAGASPMAGTLYSYAATSGGWSGAFTGGSHIGFDWTATVQYNFWAAAGTSQVNAGQGLGYYQGYNGSTFGVWSQWYSLGSATKNGGGAAVPWGNVAAVAKFRAMCAASTICGGYFQD